jgi:hypothetical protein
VMSRDDLHFRLRIPEALRDRIRASSETNYRSMTAEIIARLLQSYRLEDKDSGRDAGD